MNFFTLYHELLDDVKTECTLMGFTNILIRELIGLIVKTEMRAPHKGFKRDTKYNSNM